MTENQRMQFERPDLREHSTGVQLQSRRGLTITFAIACVIAAVLAYAAIAAIDGWAQWVVLAGILVTVIGAMIAVSPNRKA